MLQKSIITLLGIVLLCSCEKEEIFLEPGKLKVKFDNMVGNQDLELKKVYVIDGKNYTFENFRYWISNIRLQKDDGTWLAIADSYFLIEQTGALSIQDGKYKYPAQKREDIDLVDIPKGKYKAIEFGVGVDKEKNDNLSITAGELSTMKGMTNIAWMWHTSYIFSSLKGIVENNTTKILSIETGLNENYRIVTINLNSSISISSGNNAVIFLKGDILTLLKSFDNWESPVIGAKETKEMQVISDNFANNFFNLK